MKKNINHILKYCIATLLIIFFSFSAFGQTGRDIGFAEEEFRRGVQAFYRGSFNDAILQFEKALSYLPEEGLILEWLGKAYYRAGLESAAIQQWEFALDQGHGGQLLQNTIEIIKGRRALENDFSVDERYVEVGDFFGSSNETVYFGQPVGIVTNSDGSFWVSAYSTNELIQFDVNGTIIDRKRGPINGFDGPMDIEKTHDNKILVSEFNGDRVSVLDENGNYLFSFGEKGRGLGQFLGPQYIAVDSNHNIFVTDYGNARVSVFDGEGRPLFYFGNFTSPTGIAILDDFVYIVDSVVGNIYCYDNAGNFVEMVVQDHSFAKPESITVIDDFLVITDSNKIYAVSVENGIIWEIANAGNSPLRLTSANLDSNSNLIATDFQGNQVYVLSKMSELIGGLYVEIVRVNADKFPQVAMEVKVENRRREPVVGLKDVNFLVTENKYNVTNQKLTGAASHNDVCDITIIIDRNISMKQYEAEVTQAVKEIAKSMNGKGTLRIISDGAIPGSELVVNPSSVTNFQISKLKTGYTSKTSTDLAIRLACNELINAELKRGIIYITNGDDSADMKNYSLTDLTNYMNNNEISFSVVSVENGGVSSEIQYLVDNSKGFSYYIYRPEGISSITEDILGVSSGVYTFTYTSSLSTNFGREFLPVEVEVYLLNRSGRAETGYYAPLE